MWINESLANSIDFRKMIFILKKDIHRIVFLCYSKIPCLTELLRNEEGTAWTIVSPISADLYPRITWKRAEDVSRKRKSSKWQFVIWNTFKVFVKVNKFCSLVLNIFLLQYSAVLLICSNLKFLSIERNFYECLDYSFFILSDSRNNSTAPIHSHAEDSVDSISHSATSSSAAEHYRLGFQECLNETMHFLVDVEGFFARDSMCVQLIGHLQQHCEKILATS